MKNEGLKELLRAEWFSQLRILDLSGHGIGDKGVSALAAHPAAKSLRVLRLGQNVFGKTGLTALGPPGGFPDLTTLDLGSYLKRRPSEADVLAFLSALHLPRLRHLVLRHWPVGNAGAKLIARSPAFASLRRLDLAECGIGDAGAKALFASPHLQQLVELRLDNNGIKTGANALADPTVMPRLGECWLSLNEIPKASAAKIEGTGRWVIL
jgi:Ran GTPase-activating protein (RanGAP) involved in mRNA processing and transport